MLSFLLLNHDLCLTLFAAASFRKVHRFPLTSKNRPHIAHRVQVAPPMDERIRPLELLLIDRASDTMM